MAKLLKKLAICLCLSIVVTGLLISCAPALKPPGPPPPPPKLTSKPPIPHPGAKWVEGHWAWKNGKWVWIKGHWK